MLEHVIFTIQKVCLREIERKSNVEVRWSTNVCAFVCGLESEKKCKQRKKKDRQSGWDKYCKMYFFQNMKSIDIEKLFIGLPYN